MEILHYSFSFIFQGVSRSPFLKFYLSSLIRQYQSNAICCSCRCGDAESVLGVMGSSVLLGDRWRLVMKYEFYSCRSAVEVMRGGRGEETTEVLVMRDALLWLRSTMKEEHDENWRTLGVALDFSGRERVRKRRELRRNEKLQQQQQQHWRVLIVRCSVLPPCTARASHQQRPNVSLQPSTRLSHYLSYEQWRE